MGLTLPEVTIVGQIPKSESKYGQPFLTADQAALAALDEILPVSIGNDLEYSGAIVQNMATGYFSFTYAETEDSSTSSNPNPQPPPGTKIVGVYHTHGASRTKKNAENFSADDLIICRTKGVVFWLGTPSKRIRKLTPPQLLGVTSRKIVGLFSEQLWVEFVPVLHRLQGCLAAQG